MTRNQIDEIMNDVKAVPLFTGCLVYRWGGTIVDTTKVDSMITLCNSFFNAGQNYKISEIKRVLEIVDPRT